MRDQTVRVNVVHVAMLAGRRRVFTERMTGADSLMADAARFGFIHSLLSEAQLAELVQQP